MIVNSRIRHHLNQLYRDGIGTPVALGSDKPRRKPNAPSGQETIYRPLPDVNLVMQKRKARRIVKMAASKQLTNPEKEQPS